ncbi:molybdate ABC transporter substrate-binding protein [Novosphingopyxis sp. YJ-S2-01]|uniref:molybdate ABC transporter substrate-binding protein n=1 Tax=Novosphingopyxis sp. YJ-S2-01 TaxID=2794021 RepID=UPI0018DC7EC1|nr:molybdate ABC transporter substrate-binding protein [Novosphingopyxis sp. YJ-S2-01]MBH9536811.1 molybdate ABC transporter substrate-binding protein [Novosphingopyxis sp. YJ-S2-01]
MAAISDARAVAILCLALALSLLAACGPATSDRESGSAVNAPPLVLAASSLQESLEAAADAWAAKEHERPTLSFAATSALARQIDERAPADLFLSADQQWMDHVEARGLIDPKSRANFVGNSIVLVAPRNSNLSWSPGGDLSLALGDGKLAMADPDAVPAGKYGKAALESLGQWNAVSPDIVRAENVRAALAFVERGAAAAGVVYGTDAAASDKVRVVATFPASSHPPIVYPLAQLNSSRSKDAAAFRGFLLSPEGQAIFRRYGFTAP